MVYNKFNSTVEAMAEKKHNFGADQLKIALCSVAPVAANAVLADLTPITPVLTGVNPLNVTVSSSEQVAGLYKLILADLTLTADTGGNPSFRYVVVYNDSATNKELIGFYDYGGAVVLNAGEQFIIDFDPTNGVLQLT